MTGAFIRLPFIDRRTVLAGGLAALGAGPAAFSQQPPPSAVPAGGACLLTPQATEGPYYFDPKLERSDITEGRPGSPLRVIIAVQGADCRPLAGARVDLWHCDAKGVYSGYDGAAQPDARGETFLRGWQRADGGGEVQFATLYPGWYPGRTPHVHLKVILSDRSVLTSQLFFPEGLNEAIFRKAEYARPGARDRFNADDNILRDMGEAAFGSITEDGKGGHLVRLRVGVDPAARPAPAGPMDRGRGRGEPGRGRLSS